MAEGTKKVRIPDESTRARCNTSRVKAYATPHTPTPNNMSQHPYHSQPSHINPKTGFKNYRPIGRQQRQDQLNTQKLEKKRLLNRREGFVRSDGIENPIETPEWSAAYVSEADRFMKDSAGEEKAEREYRKMMERQRIEKIRHDREERDQSRWAQREQKMNREHERLSQLDRRKNESSVAYNLISKETNDPKQRQVFEYENNMMAYSGAKRAQRLYRNQNREQYNPLTGEALPERVRVPDRPQRPEFYDEVVSRRHTGMR